MHKEVKPILFIAIFVLFLALPFSNKAYHIDDTAFIYVADQIAKDPLRPYSFILEWGGHSNELATHLLDTPLVSYYISFISLVFGRSEIILHTSFILFNIIAGISFYFLAKKFIEWPLIATLIMLATPTYLVNSHNLMLDVPMLSLFLLSSTLFIYGVDKNNHKLLFIGSIAAGFAYLAKPNAIIIIPLLLLYCFIKKKSKYMAYQAIPAIIIVLFAVHNYIFENIILIANYLPFLAGKKGHSINTIAAYFFSNLSYVGGATIFTLFLVCPFIFKKRNLVIYGISLLITALISKFLYNFSSSFISGKYTLLQILLFFIFTSSSIFYIFLIFLENYNNAKLTILNIFNLKKDYCNSNTFFVFAWFIGIYILNSVISGGAVRYNTLFLPPLILSYFILLKKYSKKTRIRFPKLLFFILLLTIINGLIVAYADYDYANSYREFVRNIPQKYKTGNTIWFTGSLGFQYYMQENGYKMLLQNDNSPKKGDIIIKARLPSPRKITDDLIKRIKLIDTISYNGKIPIRTQNPEAHAGFYTYGGGFLPYSFSNSKLENFEIYQVVK